jgi:hypothetical protein
MAVPVSTIGSKGRLQVELVDDVEDEPGQMVAGQPVTQVRGSRRGWSRLPRKEVVGHGAL